MKYLDLCQAGAISYEKYDVMVYGFAFATSFSDINMKKVYDKLLELYDEISEDMIMSIWDEKVDGRFADRCCWLIVADKYLEGYQIREILDFIMDHRYEDYLVLFYPNL